MPGEMSGIQSIERSNKMKENKLRQTPNPDEKMREFARRWMRKLNFYTPGHVSEGMIKTLVEDYERLKET